MPDSGNKETKVSETTATNTNTAANKAAPKAAEPVIKAAPTPAPASAVAATPKTMTNTTAKGASEQVKDIEFWGNGDTFLLISKASSESEGWMKSTKGMIVKGAGVIVQVTTQQRNKDGSYAVAEALTFVPNAGIVEVKSRDTGEVVQRRVEVKGA